MTGQIAIVLDGMDAPAPSGSVAFPARDLGRPRRPWMGLAIAVVTAVVTMGAMGPRSNDEMAAALAAACPAVAPPDLAAPAELDSAAPPAAPAAPAAPGRAVTPIAWWLLPRQVTWVDPATGMTRQAEPVATPRPTRIPWWPLARMALRIDPATAVRMDSESRDHDRVADDRRRDH